MNPLIYQSLDSRRSIRPFIRTIAVNACYWAGLIAAIVYLLIDPTHFNKDDNFSQFTPVFQYAYEALLEWRFPWITPVDFTSRLASAP